MCLLNTISVGGHARYDTIPAIHTPASAARNLPLVHMSGPAAWESPASRSERLILGTFLPVNFQDWNGREPPVPVSEPFDLDNRSDTRLSQFSITHDCGNEYAFPFSIPSGTAPATFVPLLRFRPFSGQLPYCHA